MFMYAALDKCECCMVGRLDFCLSPRQLMLLIFVRFHCLQDVAVIRTVRR